MSVTVASSQDSDDLEALFDSIVAENSVKEAPPAGAAPVNGDAEVVSRLGHLARSLHDSMRELGYDKIIAQAADSIPDSRDRLNYIATMTEKAASRTLTATEAAQPLQDKLEADATTLNSEWEKLYANRMSVDEFKVLAGKTRDFLRDVPVHARATNAQLHEIMMAQDFQDLTGQVIKRMTDIAREVEKQLLELLIEHLPPDRRNQLEANGLAGPNIHGKSAQGVVTDQAQVDDLLESLGF
ncbi:MAG: protein phosphatase CheZ [Burkholderiales bacterium]|nr:protein phosphatase CheZ [Burkholderiales bacterium]